jgi:hypothetical protein
MLSFQVIIFFCFCPEGDPGVESSVETSNNDRAQMCSFSAILLVKVDRIF